METVSNLVVDGKMKGLCLETVLHGQNCLEVGCGIGHQHRKFSYSVNNSWLFETLGTVFVTLAQHNKAVVRAHQNSGAFSLWEGLLQGICNLGTAQQGGDMGEPELQCVLSLGRPASR
ncbi:hypothetical protein DUNSADRAFT_7961 [Dunaliella salina]|uniref:Uncharacterized protein n=1 Tax=Dunaliella salina TaxID=3046 RepID=A0ABQ7H635_DUNSA|nr:hypothetical protein DUNSADRAFT_7961 [Dunaliella salina]|eukprot:KAF5842308.1 hypothetical protein DUNSADRAFT_7961 [Dunaliella salina]